MLEKCISENHGFGVVAKLGDEFSAVGTYTTITDILRKYPTGETDILVKGWERFRTIEFRMHSEGYYEADVESYTDTTSSFDTGLLAEMQFKFEELLMKTSYQLEEGFWENYRKSDMKSFKVAEKSGLILKQQQELLLLRNENDRLAYLIKHLEMLKDAISENTVIKSMVLGDGYVN